MPVFLTTGPGTHSRSRRVSSSRNGRGKSRPHHQPSAAEHQQPNRGATLGFKIMVGLLREDSRMEFHANGPYNNVIKNAAKGSTLSPKDDESGTFFEKIVEISGAIKDKLRLTMVVATEAQTTFGPDR
jgi:Domain of unknown function (DUF362)